MAGADSIAVELAEWIASMPAGGDERVEAARQRIGRLSRLFGRLLDGVADRQGISTGDLAALSVLRRIGAPYAGTPSQLAEALALTSGTVSVRIERLMLAGLVEPVPAADGRSRPVRLTALGHRRWRDATRRRAEAERELLHDALDDQQWADLNALLGTLLARLEERLGPASRHDAPTDPR